MQVFTYRAPYPFDWSAQRGRPTNREASGSAHRFSGKAGSTIVQNTNVGVVSIGPPGPIRPNSRWSGWARFGLGVLIDPGPGHLMVIDASPHCAMSWAIAARGAMGHTSAFVGLYVQELDFAMRVVRVPIKSDDRDRSLDPTPDDWSHYTMADGSGAPSAVDRPPGDGAGEALPSLGLGRGSGWRPIPRRLAGDRQSNRVGAVPSQDDIGLDDDHDHLIRGSNPRSHDFETARETRTWAAMRSAPRLRSPATQIRLAGRTRRSRCPPRSPRVACRRRRSSSGLRVRVPRRSCATVPRR